MSIQISEELINVFHCSVFMSAFQVYYTAIILFAVKFKNNALLLNDYTIKKNIIMLPSSEKLVVLFSNVEDIVKTTLVD